MAEQDYKFLAIKNWDKRQPGRRGRSEWIKDYTEKDSHPKYEKLTFFQRQVLDGCRRLRGRLGENIPNDPMYIARALHAVRTDRPHVSHTVSTLTAHGFLILTNQRLDFVDIDIEKEIDIDKESTKPSARKARRARLSPSPKRVTDSAGETKHKRIEGMLKAAWEDHNPGAGKCPWGPDDGAQLKRMLEKTANWPDTSYAQCIGNLYRTEGFPRSELPVFFLPRLPTYFQGPKDRYNREIGAYGNGNGAGNSKADRRSADVRTTTERVRDRALAAINHTPGRLQEQAVGAGTATVDQYSLAGGGAVFDARDSRGSDRDDKKSALVRGPGS